MLRQHFQGENCQEQQQKELQERLALEPPPVVRPQPPPQQVFPKPPPAFLQQPQPPPQQPVPKPQSAPPTQNDEKPKQSRYKAPPMELEEQRPADIAEQPQDANQEWRCSSVSCSFHGPSEDHGENYEYLCPRCGHGLEPVHSQQQQVTEPAYQCLDHNKQQCCYFGCEPDGPHGCDECDEFEKVNDAVAEANKRKRLDADDQVRLKSTLGGAAGSETGLWNSNLRVSNRYRNLRSNSSGDRL